jgi:hypothetical protein
MNPFRRWLHPIIVLALLAVMSAQETGETRVDFVSNTVEVEGVAVGPARFKDNPPAAYLSAREAAKVLADAQLASLLAGLYADVSLDGNGARQIREELPRTHIPGGTIVTQSSLQEFKDSGHVTVRVRYRMGNLMPLILGGGRAERLRAAQAAFAPAAARRANANPAAPADGLIIVVPENFKPSLAPKVFNTSSELVYSAGSLDAQTLSAKGAAQYTTTAARARQLLQEQGAQQPLEIGGMVRGGSDLVLPEAESARVIGANGQTHFLEKGRVVIVIGGKG